MPRHCSLLLPLLPFLLFQPPPPFPLLHPSLVHGDRPFRLLLRIYSITSHDLVDTVADLLLPLLPVLLLEPHEQNAATQISYYITPIVHCKTPNLSKNVGLYHFLTIHHHIENPHSSLPYIPVDFCKMQPQHVIQLYVNLQLIFQVGTIPDKGEGPVGELEEDEGVGDGGIKGRGVGLGIVVVVDGEGAKEVTVRGEVGEGIVVLPVGGVRLFILFYVREAQARVSLHG